MIGACYPSGADPLRHPAGFVDQLNPLGGELIADPVGLRVILRSFRCLARRDGCINGAVVEAGGGFGFRAQSQHRRQVPQQLPTPLQTLQLLLAQGGVFSPFQPVGEGPQGLGQIEQHGQSARAVEVIVHGADEALFELHQSGVVRAAIGVMRPPAEARLCSSRGCRNGDRQDSGLHSDPPAGGCSFKGLGGEIKRFAVVGLQHKKAQGHRRDSTVQQGADGGEVAERFGHLGATDIDHAVVHPQFRQGCAVGGFRLSDLVFVVREHQISATEVNVDGLTQFLAHHC